MDTSEEKKPRRPRIGENRIAASSAGEGSFSNAERTATPGDDASSDAPRREYSSYDRPYQPRPYTQRGYNNGRSGYNNQGGYNNNRQQG